MTTAYIGIGSNLGDRLQNCRKALKLLEQRGVRIRVKNVSGAYETKPWGPETADQPDFINMAAAVETDIGPRALLEILLRIENEMGRVRTKKWGPRTIDLDILLYGDEVVDLQGGSRLPALKVPHPLMHKREFVLLPLAEIAPGAVHPVLKKTVKQLLEELATQT
ncbi:MAG: 2-amino-4-hydroxy-6-hydroxymethyldihydropteridine diphosphokinase [Nitrospiraceae bacterium]|nr:2-amino-4-hydroxy-6-hydroxymethyldihydropteridine diphosphokinase [Nitrospiraceae bacterium]